MSLKGFISYAHDDHEMFVILRRDLKQVERGVGIEFWADERLKAGDYWNAEISQRVAAADICILLASPAFIASDYIFDHELPAINEQHAQRGTLVIPVILRPMLTALVGSPFQCVPTNSRGSLMPITSWWRREDGFATAVAQIAAGVCAFADAPLQSLLLRSKGGAP